MKKFLALCLLAPAAALVACRSGWKDDDDMARADSTRVSEASSTRATLSLDDREFVEQAAYGGLFEVRSSKLALEKDVNGHAREIDERMVRDHEKANRELAQLARERSFLAPTELDAKHRGMLDELSALSGDELERRYLEMQRKAHDDAISLFERAAQRAQDKELRSFAARTLPTLREHKKHIERGDTASDDTDG